MTGDLKKTVKIRNNSRETPTKQISGAREHIKMYMDNKNSFASATHACNEKNSVYLIIILELKM